MSIRSGEGGNDTDGHRGDHCDGGDHRNAHDAEVSLEVALEDIENDVANNPPECIRKKGIHRATTNLKEGEELNVSRYIWLFFGDDIKARYLTHGEPATKPEPVQP